MADDLSWLTQIMSQQLNPGVGPGAGMLAPTALEALKASIGMHNNAMKIKEVAGATPGAIPNAPDQLPLDQTLSQAVAGGGAPSAMDNFMAGLNTPAGAGGLAAILGNVGAAISKPNTWQARLGTTAANMGRGAVAADAVQKLTDKLVPPTPGAPNANFQVAPLLLPQALKWGQ